MKIKIFIKKIFTYLMRLYKKFIEDGCQVYASSIAFYSILSIFPALLMLISLSGVLINKFSFQSGILVFVEERIPVIYDFADNNISEIIKNRANIGIIGFFILFVTSAYVFDSIQLALNKIFKTEANRKFWKQKIFGFLIMFLIFFIIVITFGLSTGLFYLSNTLAGILNIEKSISAEILKLLSVAIGIVFNFLIFTLIYYLGINRKVNFRQIFRGTLTVAVGLECAKHIFVYYLDRFAGYQSTYGSVGSVIAFLTWVYMSSLILLLGAEINSLRPENLIKF
jgi:membrane protein